MLRCAQCSRDFKPFGRRRLYCDDECLQNAKRERESIRAAEERQARRFKVTKKTCKKCGKEFKIYGYEKQTVYCNVTCSNVKISGPVGENYKLAFPDLHTIESAYRGTRYEDVQFRPRGEQR